MGNCLKCWNVDSSEDVQPTRENRRGQHEPRRVRYPGFLDNDPILHPTPGVSRPMSQLTEEEQVKIATRMGLISTLPLFKFDEGKREKLSECIICMCEYEEGEELRYLPCLHTYHRMCIDDWLMRALTCPSCLEEIRPSSPSAQRSGVDASAQLAPLGTATEPPSYASSQPVSTPQAPEVPTSAAEATTFIEAEALDAPRDSLNQGDSVPATLQDPLTDQQSNIDPDRSSTSGASCAKIGNATMANNNSNGSGGDCISLATVISTIPPPIPRTQHRRTRSSEHGTAGSNASFVRGPLTHSVGPTQLSDHYRRRGHSVTGVEWPFAAPGTAVSTREAAVEANATRPAVRSGPTSRPRQLGGDSVQSPFP